jgi:hypothetical protein
LRTVPILRPPLQLHPHAQPPPPRRTAPSAATCVTVLIRLNLLGRHATRSQSQHGPRRCPTLAPITPRRTAILWLDARTAQPAVTAAQSSADALHPLLRTEHPQQERHVQLARMLTPTTARDQRIVLGVQFQWIVREADPACIALRPSISHARRASHTARLPVSAKI